jgi:chromosome segregation ATPase
MQTETSTGITWAQVVIVILGGSGLVALTTLLSFVASRFDNRRQRKKEEEQRQLHNTVETKKVEFESLIKSAEFTSAEYVKIIQFLNNDKAEKEKENLELSLFVRSAKETIQTLQEKMFDLEIKIKRQETELEDSRHREDDCNRRLKELEEQMLKLKRK